MTTFMKAKLGKSDGQTNMVKYIVAAHKLLQNLISSKNLIYYVFIKLRNRIIDMDTLTFLDLIIEMLCFLYN